MSLTNEELKWATILALTEPPQRCKPGEPPEPPGPIEGPWLTFHSEDGEFTVNVYDRHKHWDGILEWSTDTETWTEWPGNTILSSSGGYLYMRGRGNSVITGVVSASNYRWVLTGSSIACTGNIENLLDQTIVASDVHPTMSNYCYSSMFNGCTNLTTAPELPATTLTTGCYRDMFIGCTRLTTAPELPATTLTSNCYYYMFSDCTSLTTAPDLPATTLASMCYSDMFAGCTSLTTAPELPATTLAYECYGGMFYGCTSLTTLPELPATTLTQSCYRSMFYGCRSLHVSTISSSTYSHLYRIPTIGTGITASAALTNMFANTGGPFTGTPEINTTYYTDHEPV